jgi:hypothetical protein
MDAGQRPALPVATCTICSAFGLRHCASRAASRLGLLEMRFLDVAEAADVLGMLAISTARARRSSSRPSSSTCTVAS